MIVETRKLDATDTKPDRIKVTAEDGAKGEFPYPYTDGLDGQEAHAWAVQRMFSGPEFGEPMWLEAAARGEKFRVPGGENLRERDKKTMKDVMAPLDERQEAFRRHNQRSTQSGT
jgi:hypothetical protein